MLLFQSNLRKQIRNLPKILNFVKKFTIIQNYSLNSLGLADALRGLGELKGSFSSADLSRQVIELPGSVVSSPEPCASSGGRLPEALLMVF